MINRGNLNFRLHKAVAVRLKGGRQEIVVRSITEQILMQRLIIRHCAVGFQPGITHRRILRVLKRAVKTHRAPFNGLLTQEQRLHFRRQVSGDLAGNIGFRGESVRARNLRHGILMLKTALFPLERGGHIENRFSVLNSADTAGTETFAVTQIFHIINNRFMAVARAQKIAVE